MVGRWSRFISRQTKNAEAHSNVERTHTRIPRHIGQRRKAAWWEPIFNPDIEVSKGPYDWNLSRDSGPSQRYIAGSTLDAHVQPGITFSVINKTFRDCDFQGPFHVNPILKFDHCKFEGCDFAHSSWIGAHFNNCKFVKSSLSYATFENCEFRDCDWECVGVTSRTKFNRTFLSNPKIFVNAMFSGNNPDQKNIKHMAYQWYRLSGTKAHVLRSLMISHSSVGDEEMFYKIVKAHEIQRISAQIAQSMYEIAFLSLWMKIRGLFKLFIQFFDYILIQIFGNVNKWGDSVGLPFILYVCLYFICGFIYKFYDFKTPIAHPFQKSFDLSLIVGYGNQISNIDSSLNVFQNIHVMASVILYTIFLSTVTSKLSKAR